MTVEVYLCEKFHYRHERIAFGRFLQEMLDRYRDSDDLYLIIGEPEANTASMDMIVLTHHALIVVELKELTFAEGLNSSEIILSGQEKGEWKYAIIGGATYNVGSIRKERNPYQQVKDHNYKLRDWLVTHSKKIFDSTWSSNEAIRKIYSWSVFSPGYNAEKSDLDLPIDEIDRWFKCLSIDQLAWEVETAINPELELSDEQMRAIATLLGASKRENLREFVPNYVPPIPKLSFFSRPPITKQFIDRDLEKISLLKYLDNKRISVICLGGPGGIGKTYLAAWFFNEAINRGYQGLWIDCAEREVTCNSFLAAIADKMPDKYQAALMHDPDRKIIDKFDLAIEFLDQAPNLLVFNDFHCISKGENLSEFFTRIVQRADNLKVLLISRIRPPCLDIPDWAPGTNIEISLRGLPKDTLTEYDTIKEFSSQQIEKIWECTSGNPYAIGLLLSLLRKKDWENNYDTLPLFDDERAQKWADSLIETLPNEVRTLLCRVAVERSTINRDLIMRLSYKSKEDTNSLIAQAVDAYVMHETNSDQYQIQGYIRAALLSKAVEKDILKAHGTAGNYFQQRAMQLEDSSEKIEFILQSLYHFENANNWNGILSQAQLLHELLTNRGDRDRLYIMTKLAVKAAKELNHQSNILKWLIYEIGLEIDLNRLDEAKKNIIDALNLIPNGKSRESSELKKQWDAFEAQLWIQKGRLAYLEKDQDSIDKCFCKGLELAELAQDQSVLADSLVKVARIERHRGNSTKSKQYFIDGGNIAYKLGDDRLLSKCVSHLGLIERENKNFNEAKRLFMMALKKAQLSKDINGEEINRGLLGDLALRAKDYETAESIFRERLAKDREVGNNLGVRITLGWLLEALIGLGKLEEAEKVLLEYSQRVNDAKDDIGSAWLLRRKGQLEHAKGNIEEGNKFIREGINKLNEIDNALYIHDFEKVLITTPVPIQYEFWNQQKNKIDKR